MYAHSQVLRRPPDAPLVLWRYISVDRLAQIVNEGSLYFANLQTFKDGREGALTRRTHERLARWFQQNQSLSATQAHEQVAEYMDHKQNFYVSCWHMNPHESFLMWKAYADRGVAIRTTFERLRASLLSEKYSVTGGMVDYVDFERDFTPIGNVFHHAVTKDSPYIDEREFRVLFWSVDPLNAAVEKSDAGVRLSVDVGMLIDCVVVSPFFNIDDETKRLLASKGIEICDSRIVDKRSRADA